jgi:hypothetical protein
LFVLQDQINQMRLDQMTGTGCFAADLDFVWICNVASHLFSFFISGMMALSSWLIGLCLYRLSASWPWISNPHGIFVYFLSCLISACVYVKILVRISWMVDCDATGAKVSQKLTFD